METSSNNPFAHLKSEISKHESFLDFLRISINDFSTSIQLELEDFGKLIKYNPSAFSLGESTSFIFVPPYSGGNPESLDFQEYEYNYIFKLLKLFKQFLEGMIIKIKSSLLNKDFNYKSKHFDTLEHSDRKIVDETLKSLKSKAKYKGLGLNSNVEEQISIFALKKDELIKMSEYKLSLQTQIKQLELKMKPYMNLPSDINRIRELLELKRKEYQTMKSVKN